MYKPALTNFRTWVIHSYTTLLNVKKGFNRFSKPPAFNIFVLHCFLNTNSYFVLFFNTPIQDRWYSFTVDDETIEKKKPHAALNSRVVPSNSIQRTVGRICGKSSMLVVLFESERGGIIVDPFWLMVLNFFLLLLLFFHTNYSL